MIYGQFSTKENHEQSGDERSKDEEWQGLILLANKFI
jgi:hypothetical protein